MYATLQIVYAGTDLHLLARQMGTSIAMLEQHYGHLIPRSRAEQARRAGEGLITPCCARNDGAHPDDPVDEVSLRYAFGRRRLSARRRFVAESFNWLSICSRIPTIFVIMLHFFSSGESAELRKHDIQGLELGMSRDDALKKLDSMHCSPPNLEDEIDCGSGFLHVEFASDLESHPLVAVSIRFENKLSMEDLIKSIDQQFDVRLTQYQGIVQASLGAERTITFRPAGQNDWWYLIIVDQRLIGENKQAKADLIRRNNRPQKF